MKKYLSLLVTALLTLGFAACEDVPAPYSINEGFDNTGGGQAAAGAEGDGTAASPFNSIAANIFGKTLAQGQVSDEEFYIHGYIVSIKEEFSTNYGNGTFYISTDPNNTTNQFYVYRTLYLGNQRYKAGQTQIKVGDEVVIYGKIANFNGTIETADKASYLYSLNGETVETETPEPQPTTGAIFSEPFTSSLGNFTTFDKQGNGYNWTYNSTYKCAYMTSYASQVNNPANAWLISPVIDLKGVNEAYVSFDYKLAYASGNNSEYKVLISDEYLGEGYSVERALWTELPVTWTMLSSFSGASWSNTGKLAIPSNFIGKTVTIAIQYISTQKAATWEIQNFVVAEGAGDEPKDNTDDPTQGSGTTVDPGDVSGSSVTIVAKDFNFSNAYELSSHSANGISLNFQQGSGTTSPKYYDIGNSFRLYAMNSLTVTSTEGRSIKAIILNCDVNGADAYVGNDMLSVSSGTITKNTTSTPPTVTITGINAPEVEIANNHSEAKGGTQLRIISMEIIFNDGTASAIRRRR